VLDHPEGHSWQADFQHSITARIPLHLQLKASATELWWGIGNALSWFARPSMSIPDQKAFEMIPA
jgi:hypothetical protein